MATSGTTTFESGFYIDDIITEAYERLGRFDYSGNDIKTARRSLNIMFQEWGNRGLHFWEVKNNSITLVQDQTTYTMYRSTSDGTSDATAVYGVDDILEAVYRNSSGVDFPLTKINRSAYQGLSNKTQTGVPTQYFVQRFIDKVTITLYLTPSGTEAGNLLTIIMSAGFRMPGPMVIMQMFHIDLYLVWYLDLHIIYHKNLNQN
jgi:hypothetical protein